MEVSQCIIKILHIKTAYKTTQFIHKIIKWYLKKILAIKKSYGITTKESGEQINDHNFLINIEI